MAQKNKAQESKPWIRTEDMGRADALVIWMRWPTSETALVSKAVGISVYVYKYQCKTCWHAVRGLACS